MFDREGSGYLEAKELKKVLLNLGEQMSSEEVEDMLKVANLDQDGQLNYRRKFLLSYGPAYEILVCLFRFDIPQIPKVIWGRGHGFKSGPIVFISQAPGLQGVLLINYTSAAPMIFWYSSPFITWIWI